MTPTELPYKTIVLWLAVVCLILTAFLLIWPDIFRVANRALKKWVSTDFIEKQLNRTHDIDEQLLGMYRIMGYLALLLSVIFILLLIR